jgi:hypothetical protein
LASVHGWWLLMPAEAAATTAAMSWCLEPALAAKIAECVRPGCAWSAWWGGISAGRGNVEKLDVGTDDKLGYGPRKALEFIGYMAGVCLQL